MRVRNSLSLGNGEGDRFAGVCPGGRMRALYGRPEARRYDPNGYRISKTAIEQFN